MHVFSSYVTEAANEFLYAADVAEGIVLTEQRFDGSGPVNVGSGQEINIKDLVHLIAYYTGFEGEILWNRDMLNGQPMRCVDLSRAEKLFGFKAKAEFTECLRRTMGWYRRVQYPETPATQGV